MYYRERNDDGTLGKKVETPGHMEPLRPEVLAALEAITMMQIEIENQKAEIDSLKAEISALKGGE